MLRKKNRKGQSLIGVLIAMVLLVILTQALFALTNASYRLVGFNRAGITARHLALEKMEVIRNLPYDDVGTIGGIPQGILTQTESVVRNGLNYTVKISVVYIDDSFDDLAPLDLLPIDYKRSRVEVSWEGLSPSRGAPIVLTTDIAPKGIETTAGGGTLSILVFDANALSVPQADVRIQSSGLTPAVDLSLQTNDSGRIILPGTPVCTQCYSITVTKPGYSSDQTYTISQVANPTKPLQTILSGQVTSISFTIDKVSTINITSVNNREGGFTPRASVDFTLQGQKTIGTDIDDLPVYKYVQNYTTDANGQLALPNMEWDNYDITPQGSLVISGSNPQLPLSLLPDTTVSLTFALSTQTAHSLLATFTDGSVPIASASATLSDGVGYSESKFTGASTDPDFGQAFFSNLSQQRYTLDATASGFLDHNGTVDVEGYTTETTILSP